MTEGRREIRIAAISDVHYDGTHTGAMRELFAEVHKSADVLALCGDLTTHGRPEQMAAFIEELAGVEVPIVAVLGNHDYESGAEEACTRALSDAGVHVLDGTHVIIEGVGFAGTKGFAGGFGRGALGPFGEPLMKAFVNAALDEALKIEKAMRHLNTETKIVLLHYSPVVDTVIGEPEVIYPFLGSSRLVGPLDTLGATVVLHGHAHHGALEGMTPGGVPVFNVSLPLLAEAGMNFRLVTVPAPDRRREPELSSAGGATGGEAARALGTP
ncbi:MAG TPA: metallophosphoesterase [Longimicrobiales bacterium]|nr:metallophosphoesterase [Longimicrobiales bacterium]